MTRFARAKGSKASNLKAPEDSTPWEVMKEDMLRAKQDNEEAKKREGAEQQRIDNYNKFLKEHRVQKRKATWCEFPESQPNKKAIVELKQRKKEKTDTNDVSTNVDSRDTINNDTKKVSIINSKPEKNKPKKKKNNFKLDEAKANEISNVSDDLQTDVNQKSPQKKKKNKLIPQNDDRHNNVTNDQAESPKKEKKKPKKVKKSKESSKNLNVGNSNIEDSNVEHSAAKNTSTNNIIKSNNYKDIKPVTKKEKKKLKKDEQPNRRKPINDGSFQLIINGKDVELVRYDGFPIMKRDAERLDELKNNMIKKGIPKSEVQRTMKLERRRAEKALARVKRDVCYNCRKGGHNLSDCPDLKSNLPGVDAAEGLCFKCGSTEHRQFECKVQRDKEFRFATCFICKESGHIARQCPDNPKGLYPNGGCCKLCGDVTHMRKDCPTVHTKKEETSIKLQTLNDDNIEDIGQQTKAISQETVKKPKKIKF